MNEINTPDIDEPVFTAEELAKLEIGRERCG
jgi:hypothetical protein